MKEQILIVDDEKEIADLVTLYLENEGFSVFKYYSSTEALECIHTQSIDLAILDIMMPEIDGLKLCQIIREQYNYPIIMLTAKSTELDKINGLMLGADDYLTKPFSVEELLARLRVTFRRLNDMKSDMVQSSVFQNGDLKIDYAAGCAFMKNTELHLTPIEYKLLCLLSQNVGKVLTHTYITKEIWGSAWDNDVASLRVFMATLRKKIEENPSEPKYIQTHVGVGYRMLRV